MDNLKEYIPLIIIIISLIFSFFKGSKKETKKDPEKTMLPEGIPQQKPQPLFIPRSSSQKPIEKTNESIPNLLDSIKQQNREKTNRLSQSTINEKISVEQDIEKEQIEENPTITYLKSGDLDELKRAIIYSEILQRKDY